jgi:hypothetical protein
VTLELINQRAAIEVDSDELEPVPGQEQQQSKQGGAV